MVCVCTSTVSDCAMHENAYCYGWDPDFSTSISNTRTRWSRRETRITTSSVVVSTIDIMLLSRLQGGSRYANTNTIMRTETQTHRRTHTLSLPRSLARTCSLSIPFSLSLSLRNTHTHTHKHTHIRYAYIHTYAHTHTHLHKQYSYAKGPGMQKWTLPGMST